MKSRRRDAGAALIVALLFLTIVLSFGLAMHANGRNLVLSNQAIRQDTVCRWAAEGAIEATRAALRDDADHAGGTLDIGDTAVTVTVSPVAGSTDQRVIVAEATTPASGPASRAGRSRIDAKVRLGASLPAILRWTEK